MLTKAAMVGTFFRSHPRMALATGRTTAQHSASSASDPATEVDDGSRSRSRRAGSDVCGTRIVDLLAAGDGRAAAGRRRCALKKIRGGLLLRSSQLCRLFTFTGLGPILRSRCRDIEN